MSSVILGRNDLIELFTEGILDGLPYIYLCLQYDRRAKVVSSKSTDIDQFISRWAGISDAETGAEKRLKPEVVIKAFKTLEKKEKIRECTINIQISLF